MGKSRPRSISISANQIREVVCSQSLWDSHIINAIYWPLRLSSFFTSMYVVRLLLLRKRIFNYLYLFECLYIIKVKNWISVACDLWPVTFALHIRPAAIRPPARLDIAKCKQKCDKGEKLLNLVIWNMESTWLFFPHSHSLHFEGIHEMNHEHWITEIPPTRSQVYPLSNLLFLCRKGSALPCSGPWKIHQLTVLLDKFASKQIVLAQIIYLLNILAYKK